MRLTRDLQGKSLRLVFKDGEIANLRVLVVSEFREHTDCRGITYDLISTNRPDRIKEGSAYWADSRDIESLEVIGD